MIRRRFQTEAINAKLFLKLFNTCVKPILLYGSKLWSVFNINISSLQCYSVLCTIAQLLRKMKLKNLVS